MSQIKSDDATAVTPPDADTDANATIDESIERLLALGIAGDAKLADKIRPLARDLLLQIDQRDAAQQMLAVQMIAAFSRSVFLARHANRQTYPKWFELFSGECDRAMTLFRRQLQTLNDIRHPRRKSFTAIRQANIAGRQIVINEPPAAIANDNHDAQPLQKTQAALPPEQNRPRRLAQQRPEEPPVAT